MFLHLFATALCILSVEAALTKKWTSTSNFNEQISAQGLLGSHFGRPGLKATFDYVVVGGGTAGLTVARRLAANSSISVAVIEAGGFYEFDNGNLSTIPANTGYFLGTVPTEKNTLIDWEQYTTPQSGCGGRTSLYASGKTFGGGSARNFMFYHRGTTGSYQKWADQVGDASYSFDSFESYFQKSPSLNQPNTDLRDANATVQNDPSSFSSNGGPLQVSYPNYADAISSWFAKALAELGLKPLAGLTSGKLFGFSYVLLTLDPATQTRSSSETSFLREAIQQTTNLYNYKSTLAKRILFTNNAASGVEVDSGGGSYNIGARKEVIVSAGAFRSPQLLMVSGIGPRATLAQNGITVLADRPGVGQNMWDHVLIGPSYEVNVATHSRLGDPATAAVAEDEYNQSRAGILTNPAADFLGFEKLPAGSVSTSTRQALDSSTAADWPDIEFLFLNAWSGYQKDLIFGAPRDGKNYASSIAGLVAPFSRGNVTIASNNTADNPIISPNWLLDPRDQEVAIAAYKRVRSVFTTKAMKPVIIGGEAFPGGNTTDAEILNIIQQSASSIYHAAATCAMGNSTDSMAVVDSKARVIGVSGLRVVDASAFPFLPPGHPQATVYALAEKIADAILNG